MNPPSDVVKVIEFEARCGKCFVGSVAQEGG